MDKSKDPIGQQLREVRKRRNVSVPELEELLGIPKDRIYKWEKGFAPKYEDRQTIENWMKDENWKKVPHDPLKKTEEVPKDNQAIIIDHSLFLQLIAEKEARRLDAEEKAKQAREDLMDAKEEKKELLAIIKENLTALQISSAKNQEYLIKIWDEQTSDDLVMMNNDDLAAGNPEGTSAGISGMYQAKLATARKGVPRKSGTGKQQKAGK